MAPAERSVLGAFGSVMKSKRTRDAHASAQCWTHRKGTAAAVQVFAAATLQAVLQCAADGRQHTRQVVVHEVQVAQEAAVANVCRYGACRCDHGQPMKGWPRALHYTAEDAAGC